jgi:hypothetical protein
MTVAQEQQLIEACVEAAAALGSIARTMELTYYKTFPPPRTPRDIDMSHPTTDEEKLRREQGATGETTTKDWMTLNERTEEEELGPRERAFLEREAGQTITRRKSEGGADGLGRGLEKTRT